MNRTGRVSQAIFLSLALLLAACMTKPPVQEMAEARSAIESARKLPHSSDKSDLNLRSAEDALREAVDAMELEQYERARRHALDAKRKAQLAARQKQAGR